MFLPVWFLWFLHLLSVSTRAGNNRFESIRWANRFESIRYGESKTNGVRFGRGHFVRSFSQEHIAQHATLQIMKDKNTSGDERPERNVFTTLPQCHCTSGQEYFLSKAHMLHIIDVVLRKALVYLRRSLSTLCILSINYYRVCSLSLHKICALCDIFSAIFVLLTTENTDDLEIRVPERLIR